MNAINAINAPDHRCPRCGSAFACGAAGPGPCVCSTLTLSATLQAQLRQQYNGCLCLPCLQTLAAAPERVQAHAQWQAPIHALAQGGQAAEPATASS